MSRIAMVSSLLALGVLVAGTARADTIGFSATGWLGAPDSGGGSYPDSPGGEDEYGGPTNPIVDSDTIGVVPQQYWNYTPTWQPSMGYEGWSAPNDRQADFPDTGALSNLKTSSGATSGVGVSWQFLGGGSDGLGWSQNEYTKPEPADKNCKMMNGLLWGQSSSGSDVTFTGLNSVWEGKSYDVIVYVDIWEIGGTMAKVSVNGSNLEFRADVDYGDPVAGTPAATQVFVEATAGSPTGNYCRFNGLSGDTLTVNVSKATGESRYWLSGIQIVPEPAALSVLAVGGMALLARRRRRRK